MRLHKKYWNNIFSLRPWPVESGSPLHFLVFSFFFLSVSSSTAQTADDFGQYKEIIIDAGYVDGSTTLIDFPFLFSTTNTEFATVGNGGLLNSPNGYDILFTNGDGSIILDHEMESYDPLTGNLIAWVKTDLDPTVNTILRIYFGSATALSNTSTNGTWATGYQAVWHMDDTSDATPTGADVTSSGSANTTNAAIGTAQNIPDGAFLQTGVHSNLNIGGNITLESWVHLNDEFSDQYANTIISGSGTDPNVDFPYYFNVERISGDLYLGLYWVYGGGWSAGDFIQVLSDQLTAPVVGNWHHFAVTRDVDNDMVHFYVNGALLSSVPYPNPSDPTPSSGNHTIRLGQSHEDVGSERIDGILDEVRVSNIIRSPEWMTTSYNSMNNPNSFFSLGALMVMACDATFTFANAQFCETTTSPSASITGDPGGTFSSPDGNITFNDINSGEVNLMASSKGGPYDIVYTAPLGCTDTFEISIVAIPSVSAAGSDQSICDNTTATLAGNTPTAGNGLWSIVSGGTGSFNDATLPGAIFTPDASPANYVLRWTISNGSCSDSADDVAIDFLDGPSVAAAGSDQNGIQCGSTTATTSLGANVPVLGTGAWSITNGVSGGSFDDNTDPTSNFTGDVNTTYNLRWTISHNGCTSSDDMVVFFAPNVNADAGPDIEVCNTTVAQLNASDPNPETGLWEPITAGITITDNTLYNTTVSGAIGSSYDLKWTVSSPYCSDPDTVTVYFTNLSSVTAGSDQTVCPSDLVTLNGSNPSTGVATWVINSGLGGSIADPSDRNSQFSGNAGETYELIWRNILGSCTEEDTTLVTIQPIISVDAGPDQNICITDATLTGNVPSSGTVDWSRIGGAGTISGSTSTTATVSGLGIGANTFVYRITEATCVNSDTVIINVESTNPVFTNMLSDTTFYFDAGCNTSYVSSDLEALITASDDCSTPNLSFTYDPWISVCGNDQSQLVTVIATDAAGNSINATFTVYEVDTISPSFVLPADITVYRQTSCTVDTTTTNTLNPTLVDDNCDAMPGITYTDTFAAGGCSGDIDIVRTWTVSDACGNSTSATQNIFVRDTTRPVFNTPRDTILYKDATCFADTLASSIGTATGMADNCGVSGSISYIDISTNQCDGAYNFRRVWTLIDDCGNSTVDTQYVQVLDTVRPTFTAPADITVYMDITCDADTAATVSQAGDVIDEDDNTCSTGLEATYVNSIDAAAECGSGYVITRTWTLIDDCGNTTTMDQLITVVDSIAPVLTVPLDIDIYLDDNCLYDADSTFTGAPSGIIDNCNSPLPDVTFSDVTVAGSCEGEFIITRTWTTQDACGNSRSYNQTINVQDTIPPTFTTPRDTILYYNASCDPISTTIALLGDVTDEADNCTSSLNAIHSDVTNTVCGTSYTIERSWSLSDNCGNVSVGIQTISVLDTTPPTYTIPPDLTLYQDGSCRADTSFVGTGFVNDESDNCSTGLIAIYRDSVVTPLCNGSYVVYRLWELADDCGNISNQTQVITVLDQVAPTFFTPQNDTIYVDNTCYADTTLAGLGNIISVLENCSDLDTTYTDIITPLCEGSYRMMRTWSLTDECGNTTSRDQMILVLDTIQPSFTIPNDTTIYTSIACTPSLLPSVIGDVLDENDNCTTTLDASYFDSSSTKCGSTETITRTWTLIDGCGNSVSGIQTIEVVDTTPPSFIVPPDITVYKGVTCAEDLTVSMTGDVTTESDYCPGVNQATFADTKYPNSCAGSFIVEREWTVTDDCGNSSSQTQIITVSDTTRPYFIMPLDQTIYADASCTADTAIGSTGIVTAAGDNCDLSPVLTFNQVITNNSCTGEYDIERTWTLTDNCGNSRTGTQTIYVRDNVAPTITPPADQTLYLGGGTTCTTIESIGFESGYEDWIQGGQHSDIEAQQPNSGTNSLRLQNNSSTSLVISPILNFSAYSQAFVDFSYYVGHMNSGETFEVQISNNGGSTYAVLQSFQEGVDFVDGERHNPSLAVPSALLSSNIRIRFRLFGDTNSEQVFFDDIAIRGCTFDSSCSVNTTPSALGTATTSSDNCTPSVSPTYSDLLEPGCNGTFILRRTWSVADDCGNTNSATQTIQVVDTISPEMIIPTDVTVYLDNVCSTIDTTTTGMGMATIIGDNCDPNPVLTYDDNILGICGQQMTIERVWTIGDACGNRRSETQTITLLDTISPTLIGIPADAHFQCSTPDAPPTIGVDITADDGCDPSVVITLNEVSTRTYNNSCTDVIYTITRTWTATDACGNSTSRIQNITAECECCNNGIDDDGDGAVDETDTDCPCTTSQVSLNCSPSYYYFVPSIWGMGGGNYNDPSKLVITTPTGTANYTIRTADGTTFNQTRSVTQGTADEITLNTSLVQSPNHNTIEDDRGFIIESDQALQVLYQLDAHYNKLLITYKGEEALGQRFRAGSQTHTCNLYPGNDDENHFISVMAAEDDTEVTFEFDMPLDGITSPHVITLDAGETYIVKDRSRANISVTGALVTADRPVAVVSGSQHTRACTNSGDSPGTDAAGRDGGADQLVPTCLLGDEYVVVRGSGNDYSNYAIIVGVTASTAIYLNGSGTPVATVGPGEFYEYELTGAEGTPHYIRTSQPAYVYHVGNLSNNNEVGMAIASPLGDCRGEGYIEFTEFTGSTNGANILVPTTALPSLEINGSLYSTITSKVATSAIPGLSAYTSITIPDSMINAYNVLSADEPFIAAQYVGVNGATGTYGYLTSFKDEVIITNPSTGVADFQYSLDTICGGLVFNHCVDATSCAGGQYITDIIPGPHTTSVWFDPTVESTCFNYTGEAGYDGFDEITIYIADAFGLITAICVDIYLCGSSPFIETIPADTLVLCDAIVPSPPVFIPINAGCSQSYDLTYDADSTITYNASCSDYAFTITRSWQLTDNCGNDTTVYQVITIADTLDPILIVPPDTLIYADGICGLDTLVSQLGEAEDLADNCDPSLSAEYRDSFEVSPICSGSFTIYRIWSITDDCGNMFRNEQLIEVRDTIDPIFTAPPDTVVYVNSICGADTSYIHTGQPLGATDNCDVGLSSSYSDVSVPGCEGSFTITRTWRVTDDCGNFSTDDQIIEVRDTTGPSLVLPSDTTLYYNVSCVVDTTSANLGLANTSSDNCDPTIVAMYRDSTVNSCDRSFTTYRIWSASDDCGNLTTEIQIITVADTTRPSMSVPRDTTIYKSAVCGIDTTTMALGDVLDESDNCSMVVALDAIYSDQVSITCNGGFTVERTWTLTDQCGNTETQVQTIIVLDTILPSLTIPADTILYVNLSCNTDTTVTNTGIATSISDNCDPSPSLDYIDNITHLCNGQYEVRRVWTLEDDCGNIARDTQLISVLDTVAPEYITPSNVTLYSDINCFADTSIANTGIARFENDNCDLTLTPIYYDSLGMGCGIGYEVFRIWSVEDDCGNNFQSTQVITILDLIDPTFTVPNDTTLYVNSICAADTTILSTGDVFDEMDNCDMMVDAIYTDVVGIQCEGGYTITRTWTVEDDCGNGVSQVQTIIVRDTTAPTFTVPRDTLLYSSASCVMDTLTSLIGDVTDEMDACDTSLDATYQDETTVICQGELSILRIWSLTDDCGNVTIDTQSIIVLDTIKPNFTIPRDTILYNDISCVVDLSASSTGDVLDESDNCDTSLDAIFVDVRVDGCDGSYVITRSWSLTDDCGNSFGGDQIIQVSDTTAPTFTRPADITIYYDATCLVNNTPSNTGDVTDEADGCDTSIDATYTDNVVAGCGNNYVLTRTWSASDDCGNVATSEQVITVLDTLAPSFVLPANATLYVDIGCLVDTSASTLGMPTSVTDNCGGAIEVLYTNTIVPSCEGSYEIQRAWSFRDECNNISRDTQYITVLDTIAPQFTPPLDVIVFSDINCFADTTISTNGSPTAITDNCETLVDDIVYSDMISTPCEGELVIIRQWTITDDCGNATTHGQSIVVRDTIAPRFTTPRDTTIYLSAGCTVDITPAALGDVTDETDGCDTSLNASYVDSNSSICGGSYDITRTWTLTDDCGNTQTGVQTIHVLDTLAPNVVIPADIDLYKNGVCAVDTTVSSLGSAVGTDNCAGMINVSHVDEVSLACEGSFNILRIWTISDQCLNTVIDTQYISVTDTTRPVFTVPVDIDVFVDASCTVDTTVLFTGDVTDEMDNCDANLDAVYSDVVVINCTGDYIIARSWTLTDDCGNATSAVQQIHVRDTISPDFTVPRDTTLYVDILCEADTTLALVGDVIDEIDNCSSGIEAIYSDVVVSGCSGSYTMNRTWTLTDDCGNTTSKIQTINLVDTLRPTLSAPPDTTLYLNVSCAADTMPAQSGLLVLYTDNCDASPIISYSDQVSFTCGRAYTMVRTWTVEDECGNIQSDDQTITVLDTIRAEFTRPADITIYKDASCNYSADLTITGDVTDESDNCDTGIQASFMDSSAPACEGEIRITRVWTLEDLCGNITRDTQRITVVDTINPTFTIPSDITITVDNMCDADTSIIGTGDVIDESDNCDISLDATYTDVVSSVCAGSYIIERTWSVTDDCGNSTNGIQTITVTDNSAPVFTTPRDTTIYMTAACTADTTIVSTGDVMDESDGCDMTLDATYSDVVSVACQNSYTITRTWRLSDDCNNESIGVQTITVLDTIRPSFTLPVDTVLYKDVSCLFDASPAIAGDVVDEDDNCATSLNATYTDATSSTCEGELIITRTWTLIDDCGNSTQGDQTITVLDSLRPSFTTPADLTLYVDGSCNAVTDISVGGDVTDESDNCDTSLNATFIDTRTDNCTGSYVIRRTWTLVDDCGNVHEDDQLITVLDTIRPTFTTPVDITLNVDISCSADTTVNNTGDVVDEGDNCSLAASLEATHTDSISTVCMGSYTIHRRWVLSDECGNTTVGTQEITVTDNSAPIFTTPRDTTIYMTAACTADTSSVSTGDVMDESDGCDMTLDATYSDVVSVACQNSYTITRTWRLSDDCNNESIGVQTITVLDTIRPSFTLPVDTVLYKDVSCLFDASPAIAGDVVDENDNCATSLNATYTDATSSTCEGELIITRTWILIDDCGNSTQGDQTITVLDSLRPSFTTPADLTLYVDGSCNAVTDISVGGDVTDESDNCDTSLDATFIDSRTDNCAGSYIIRRTWTLVDDCGNVYEDDQLITVLDTIRPTFTTPADITLNVDGMCDADTSTTNTGDVVDENDNCSLASSLDAIYSDSTMTVCLGSYTIRRMWILSDACGNTTVDSQIISVVDNTPPSFTPPNDTTIYMDQNCSVDILPVQTGEVLDNSDACGSATTTVYADVTTPLCGMGYLITRTWTVSDACLNSSVGTQTITVLDTISPTFTAPRDTIIYKDQNCLVDTNPISLGDVVDESDNCDNGLEATYTDIITITCEGTSEIMRRWSLTDVCGNSSTADQHIIIRDTLDPIFTVPGDITVYKDLSCNQDNSTVALGDVMDESDNCSTGIEATYVDDVVENCVGAQTIRRTWTLIDNCGNQYAADQTITVLDTFAPTFTRPADITLYAAISCAMDTSSATTGAPTNVDDNCSMTNVVNYADDVIEVCPGTFTIARTWSVSDICGNTSSQTQSISVIDTLAPIFSAPQDATVYASVDCIADTSTVNTGLVLRDSVQDCHPDIVIDYTDAIVTICGGSYTLERTWEVSDLCGNTMNGIQTITVLDTTAPTFTTPADTALYVDNLCYVDTMITSTGNVTEVLDGCDNLTRVEYQDVITATCSGSYIIERRWLVSDQCDNLASSIQVISVQDTVAPSFTPPVDIDVFLDSLNLVDTSLTIVGNVSDTLDNCSNDFEITYRDSIVEVMANQVAYESYRFWTIKDRCGNARTAMQLIGFIDTIPPSFVSPPVIEVDCEFVPLPDTIDFSDINNVVDITMTEVVVDTPCIDRYTIIRTWTAIDGVGNQTSVDRVIRVTSCSVNLNASVSDNTPCIGEFVSLNSSLVHPTHSGLYYPQWYFRQNPTDVWSPVTGGDQSNLTFPAYEFRSGEYKIIYASQIDHLDPIDCQYESSIMDVIVSGMQQVNHLDATICEGETYSIGNSTYFVEGDYNIVYPNSAGCDSVVTLHLDVIRRIANRSDFTICEGDYLEMNDGTRFYESGIYYDSLTNVNNCDSILIYDLTVAPIVHDTIIESICPGASFDFNGTLIDIAGMYSDTLQSSASCDSIITLDLSIRNEINRIEDVTSCVGDFYSFDGFILTRDTIWTRTLTSSNGCDSVVTLDLKFVNEMHTALTQTICSQEIYSFGGASLSTTGVYVDTLISQYGCDSILELNLLVLDEMVTSVELDLCAGESYIFKNNTYSSSQILRDTIDSSTGCDSILIYNLRIPEAPPIVEVELALCSGDSVLVGLDFVTNAGTYTRTLSNVSGCLDSAVTYNVTEYPRIVEDRTITICAGDSLLLGGTYRHVAGTYEDVGQSLISGCDSIMTTNLIIEDVIELWSEDVNICAGESFNIIVDGADNLSWSSSDLLSCNNCPNPSGQIDQTTTFTASTEGCADQQISVDVVVTVFNEVQIEVLTPDTTLTYGEAILLEANVTDPFTQISWYDAMGNLLCTNCSSVQVNPEINTFYYAEANSDSGCTVRDTVLTDVRNGCAEGEIIVPNFISPNGDGVNDELRIQYHAIRSINKMRIFNRWGQLVFKTDDIDNDRWDGTVLGKPANSGVYVYFIDYQCLNGDEVFLKGNVTILK